MSESIRIRTTPNGNDKYLKLKLDQKWDFIEILSLKISQEDAYRKFCSDYGVIVGRVVVNSQFGVPNCKVSVFIPLDDIDKDNPIIKGLYPYELVTDKDSDGIRYNLFPKDANPSNDCSSPIGTFPNKREVLDNDVLSHVYCKYYKFTTTTNHAGDFMIFGVPLGTHIVHIDADISDIGIISQRPFDLISQGTPSKMFYSSTKFNSDTNLDKLIQVKTMNSSVNVQPFWGDVDNCEVGISRLDFDLNYSIRPSAIFMGSIYGDQDKHSINKRCRPRKKLGELCEQVTGAGSIEMIRKTFDGGIEEFNVEGGRVIDNDGTWAYQIPMNLDYMVTDESGNLVLSQDPNKGIPTRASVRFNIGMDETGGEGRLRTRARYLVPNNPKNTNEIDYTFGNETKDTSFRDMYWNKIYSVSNFISRFQRRNNLLPVKSRSMTAIKDVDACAGDKTPFPYNRVNTELNPIFFIICLIIKIVAFLIFVMNSFLIPLINVIISAINSVIGVLVDGINIVIRGINSVTKILGLNKINEISWTPIQYVGCVHVQCPQDDGSTFAPGCKNGGIDNGHAWETANNNTHLDYYANDGFDGHDKFGSAVGLDDCIAFEMAKALNLFQFDFYNDWINGTLFSFLLKYKKKKRGREKFCEYDCQDWGISSGGVDGNSNGQPDNNCYNNLLLDTCFDGGKNSQIESRDSNIIRDGLIKKVNGEFYYAATTHSTNYKLFATELINLGSIYDTDWQGIPKIVNTLIPTSYKIPPDIQELDDDGTTVEACGMVDIGSPSNGADGGLFFSVNCIGLHVDSRQCLNLRHICEIGVDIDQAQEDPTTGAIITPSDCIIGSNDIDDGDGKLFRDVFFGLNNSNTPWIGVNQLTLPSGGYLTNFNLNNTDVYDFTVGGSENGNDYVNFRNYSVQNTPVGNSTYGQPNHSYFFYFGLLPGKTGLDKMNQRFFTKCKPVNKNDILIQSTTTNSIANASTGTITFYFVGGVGPYNYVISGIPPTSYGPLSGSVSGPSVSTIITGLASGTYLITGVDSLGTPVNQQVTVSGPPPFYCLASVTKNATAIGANDGEITISSVGGGSGTYMYEVKDSNGSIISGPATLITPKIISGLAVDSTIGYQVKVYDTSTPALICNTSGLMVNGPTAIVLTSTITNVTCFGGNNGGISLNISGGQAPYTITTTGPFSFSTFNTVMTSLQAGTYVTTVVDSLGTTVMLSSVITSPPQMIISIGSASELAAQCLPTQYTIPFYYVAGATANQLAGVDPLIIQYQTDTVSWNDVSPSIYLNPSDPTGTPMYVILPMTLVTTSVKLRMANTNKTCFSNIDSAFKSDMELPPAILAVNPISIPTQCVAGTASLGVNINYLSRAPYTIDYTVNGSPKPSIITSSNPTNWTTSVPSTSVNVIYTVTDSKGCVATASQVVTTPSSNLTCSISTTYNSSTGLYTHVVTGTGGIGSISGTGTFGPDSNPTITKTITDSVGCIATATG